MYLEPPVLPAAGRQLDVREQRVRLVENAVGGEVQNAPTGRVAAERRLARVGAGQHLRVRPGESRDRRDLLTRSGERVGPRREGEHARRGTRGPPVP